jgi:uncharacterized membrane protein
MEMKRVTLVGHEDMRARVTVLGHPVHAILSDLPLACFMLSFLWNVIAVLSNRQPWYAMTFWAMLTGLILVVPTAVIGLLDYTKVLERHHPGWVTATLHLVANVSATLFFLISLLVRSGPGALSGPPKIISLLLAVIGAGILSVGGFLGGRLVYHHGIGVNPDRE